MQIEINEQDYNFLKDLQRELNTQETEINNIPIYLKVPITTHYSDELSYFPPDKIHVVEGDEFCETDMFGDKVRCWYVSTTFGAVEDKEWLLHEIAELGCNPTFQEFRKGLFSIPRR